MKILAIDPGPEKSAYIIWNGEAYAESGIVMNEDLRCLIAAAEHNISAIEMVACYGMAVGKEVFETCLWIGRFVEVDTGNNLEMQKVYRREIKMHFCNSMKAKDTNIRQALLDRFGGKDAAIGKKATPGPFYGIRSHLWAALAVALYIQDQNK